MISNHERNVSGMHEARRCEALSRNGSPCRSPAVTGKKRCHVHGGRGSKAKTYDRKLSDYSKANLERDKQINREIKKLDRAIRRIERGVSPSVIVADLVMIRQGLLWITKQKQVDLAASYVPASYILQQGRARASAPSYPVDGPRSLEMVRDRARGAMLGLAVGEALGVTLENFARDTQRETTDMWGGGKLGFKPGEWGSDTATALALLDSLRSRGGLDETDFMERLLEWQDEGVYSCTGNCVGIGTTTRGALVRYQQTEDAIAGDSASVTNGSLVRVAPVAIRYWNSRAELREVAARQSRTTHASAEAVDACVAFAEVLADAISGCGRAKVFGPRELAPSSTVQAIMAGSWKKKRREEIASDDNVMNSLEAALWCVHTRDTFDEAVLRAANLGEDAGTIAALAGELAGALWGASAIRADWIERVAWYDRILEQVDALLAQSKPRSG